LVGTVAYSDHPDAVRTVPVVGDAFRIDLERLSAAAPDLVLVWLGGNPDSAIEELERLGLPVVALHAARLDDIGRHLRLIGAVAGTPSVANTAADQYDARLAELRRRYSARPLVRVFYEISARPLFTIGARHSLHDAIIACGGMNVFGSLDTIAPAVTLEAVIAAAPEVIVAGVHPYPPEDADLASRWARWPGIPAVRETRVHPLDASVMGRPTPRLLDGVTILCELLENARVSRGP
jgi:iron complex transport system substrate-binding protein